METEQSNRFIFIAALFGAAAVGIGAFGAHGLKNLILPERIEIFKTGVNYHFYHTFALLITGILYQRRRLRLLNWSANCFIIGIWLFSGSLYLLATRSVLGIESWTFLGPLTPLGGIFFIVGWIMLALGAKR